MTETRPTWLHEDCPSWCLGEHSEADHSHDRAHQGKIHGVAAVTLNRHLERGNRQLQRIVSAVEFDVLVFQYVGDPEVWFVISDERDQRLEVTLESVWRIHAAIDAVLSSVNNFEGALS